MPGIPEISMMNMNATVVIGILLLQMKAVPRLIVIDNVSRGT